MSFWQFHYSTYVLKLVHNILWLIVVLNPWAGLWGGPFRGAMTFLAQRSFLFIRIHFYKRTWWFMVSGVAKCCSRESAGQPLLEERIVCVIHYSTCPNMCSYSIFMLFPYRLLICIKKMRYIGILDGPWNFLTDSTDVPVSGRLSGKAHHVYLSGSNFTFVSFQPSRVVSCRADWHPCFSPHFLILAA